MGDTLAQKVPPTIIISTEFDFCLSSAYEAADLYERNGRLIEFGILQGLTHDDWKDFNINKSKIFFRDFSSMCNKLFS